MALVDNAWYVNFGDGSTTGYYAQTKWATGASIAAGALRRQNAAPSVGNERMFVCVVAGTTHASTEPTWGVTRGAKTTDNTVTWQECTGIAALNGDAANTPNWTTIKNTAVTLGQVIKRNNGASYQICTTAGTAGNGAEPSFSDTAGVTTSDNTVTWTSIGVVGNFTGWQAPHARLANAFTTNWGQAGNNFYVGDNHAETQNAANALNAPGTAALPCKVICVDHAGSKPPVSADLKTTATINTTGANQISFAAASQHVTYDGIIFKAADGSSNGGITFGNATNQYIRMRNCSLRLNGTGSAAKITMNAPGGTGAPVADLENTTASFAHVGQGFQIQGGVLEWKNTPSAIIGAAVPTSLFVLNAGSPGIVDMRGVDVSALGSGKTLFDNSGGPSLCVVKMQDCKLGASVTKQSITPNGPGSDVLEMFRCASDGTNYRQFRSCYEGSQIEETTIIRTGGASDGTTGVAWNIATTAKANWDEPFDSEPIAIWNDTIGSPITATVCGIWGGGAVPNNDDVWIECQYLGASGSPQASFATTTKADTLATGAACPTDTSTWGGSTTKFKMAATFTPQQKGLVLVRVRAAKASTTFYIDPKVALS